MTNPIDANTYVQPTNSWPPVDWVPIVAADADLPRPYRAIRANTDCTITVRMPGAGTTERNLPFLAGETRLGMFTRVVAISAGTAEGAI